MRIHSSLAGPPQRKRAHPWAAILAGARYPTIERFCAYTIDERTNEAAFLERERDPIGREEGVVRALREKVQAGHPVPARDKSAAWADRDRSSGLLRVLAFGNEEGLLGHGDLFQARAALRRQRLSEGFRKALQVRGRARARQLGGRAAHHRRVSQVLRRDGLYAERERRPEPPEAAPRTLGSGVLGLLQAAREEEAGHLLRRSQRRAYGARSRESKVEPRQKRLYRGRAGRLSELPRRGFRRYVPSLQAGERLLHVVEPAHERARTQRRMENRLHPGVRIAQEESEEGGDSLRCLRKRSLPGEHQARCLAASS